jgi:Flp pilus assembly protein TadG
VERRSRLRDREGGTAAVEFALVLPLVLVIALALVQVGLLVRDRLLVESAARAGARTAALQPDDAAVRSAVASSAPDLDPAGLDVTVVRAGVQGDPVTVTVAYGSAVRIPLIDWLFGATVSMSATATDRQEFG